MTREEIEQVINKLKGQGNQIDLDSILPLLFNELLGKIGESTPMSATINLSALEVADLSAEEASKVGFTQEVIRALQMADNPTIHFNDMCVTFNAVEVISDDLVNQSALIVHTSSGGGELYKCILSLYTDGRIFYYVAEVE